MPQTVAPLGAPRHRPTFALKAFRGTMPGLATFDVVPDADDAPKDVQSLTLMVTSRGALWSARRPDGKRLGASVLGPFEASREAIEALLGDAAAPSLSPVQQAPSRPPAGLSACGQILS